MANIKDNKKGFKVIQISRKELVEELGQYGAIKEHLRAKAFVADPNNLGFVDRFLEHTKAAEWGADGASTACGMMQARCQRSEGFASISLKTAPMDADIITKKIIAFGIHDLRILSNGLIFKI